MSRCPDRQAAIKAGRTTYVTGKRCKNGHLSPRRVVNCRCLACIKIARKTWQSEIRYAKSPKGKERDRRYNATPKGQERWRQYNSSPKGHERVRTRHELVRVRRAKARRAKALTQN